MKEHITMNKKCLGLSSCLLFCLFHVSSPPFLLMLTQAPMSQSDVRQYTVAKKKNPVFYFSPFRSERAKILSLDLLWLCNLNSWQPSPRLQKKKKSIIWVWGAEIESKPTITLSSPLFLERLAHCQKEQIFSVYPLHVGLGEWCFHSGTAWRSITFILCTLPCPHIYICSGKGEVTQPKTLILTTSINENFWEVGHI